MAGPRGERLGGGELERSSSFLTDVQTALARRRNLATAAGSQGLVLVLPRQKAEPEEEPRKSRSRSPVVECQVQVQLCCQTYCI